MVTLLAFYTLTLLVPLPPLSLEIYNQDSPPKVFIDVYSNRYLTKIHIPPFYQGFLSRVRAHYSDFIIFSFTTFTDTHYNPLVISN